MIRRFAAVPIGVGLLLTSASGADEKKQVKPPAVKAVPPPRPVPARGGEGRAQTPPRTPQEQETARQQRINRLLNMTPEQREKALQNLPPQQRQNLERGLNQVQKIPPAERNLAARRAEMLNSLPPQRQNQIRRSVKQFEGIPEERRQQMAQELRRMSGMSDEDRRAYMNTEEFRNKYSPTEQQIMGNISEITPEK